MKKMVSALLLLIMIFACSSIALAEVNPSNSGWTEISASTDSLIVYVSSSEGDDANDGLSTSTPVKTLAKAASFVRDGYPDHLLLKRGDVWTDETLGRFKSGRSESEPLVLSYYGESGERPKLKVSSNFIDHNGQVRSNLAIIGLHFVAYKMDPADPAFTGTSPSSLRFVGGGNNLLVEDCKLEFTDIIVQNFSTFKYQNFKLRRSMVTDVWSPNTSNSNAVRPSGIYATSVDGLLIEENLFDHNGWNENVPGAGANQYNHNMYIQTSNVGNHVTVRGNVIARASSHGVQGRPGGLYEDNLFVENSIGLQLGYKGTPLQAGTFAHAKNNVILAGKRMDPTNSSEPRTAAVWGLWLDDLGSGTVTLEGNIVANRKELGSYVGIRNYAGINYAGNIQYNWGGGIGDMVDPTWDDPARSVDSYHGSLGKTATLQAFLTEARNRGLKEWPLEYSAYTVNAYIRDGFKDTKAPTATVSYSTVDPEAEEVTATITPSEAVTITNNEGSNSYRFLFNESFTFEFVDASGNRGSATAVVDNIVSKSTGKPGKPVLSDDNGYDTGLLDGKYQVKMNLYYGNNGRIYKLYENDVLIDTVILKDATPIAQSVTTSVYGKKNGVYTYYAELTNAFGTTRSETRVVTVKDAAPGKAVLSSDNWDGDGSYKVSMNMWWGTNGSTYHLYENGVLIHTQALTVGTPAAQFAEVLLTDRTIGTYEYRAELVNDAGVTSSEIFIVKVKK